MIMASDDHFVGVITVPDAPKGRGRTSTESELATWSAERKLLLEKYENREELHTFLMENEVEIVITLSFGKIIPQDLLEIPRFGWLNVHFSALPKYRGAAPVQRSLLAAEDSIGITVFQLETGMDTGPIYVQENFPISPTATTESLLLQLSTKSLPLVQSAIAAIGNDLPPQPQNESEATYAAKLSSDEGKLTWSLTGTEILRRQRAMQENIGTWSTFRGEKINLYDASFLESTHEHAFGKILLSGAKNEPLSVACKDGILIFNEVKLSGKRRMSSNEFLRGARVESEILR